MVVFWSEFGILVLPSGEYCLEYCLDSWLDHVLVLFRKVLVTRLLLDTGCVMVDLLHCRGVLGVGGGVVGLHRSWGEKLFSVLVAMQASSSTNNF